MLHYVLENGHSGLVMCIGWKSLSCVSSPNSLGLFICCNDPRHWTGQPQNRVQVFPGPSGSCIPGVAGLSGTVSLCTGAEVGLGMSVTQEECWCTSAGGTTELMAQSLGNMQACQAGSCVIGLRCPRGSGSCRQKRGGGSGTEKSLLGI